MCFLQKENDQNIDIKNPKINLNDNFKKEIDSLNKVISSSTKKVTNNQILKDIMKCISAYLILKSHLQQNQNRIDQIILDQRKKSMVGDISENEYVELRDIGKGSLFRCALIYHIARGEL